MFFIVLKDNEKLEEKNLVENSLLCYCQFDSLDFSINSRSMTSKLRMNIEREMR